jgi:predicted RNA polymerase sigma factor
VLVTRGLVALERAMCLKAPLGPYALQGAIAACHARAGAPEDTDWKQIVALYDALAQVMPSPVVELNRAVAVSMAFGPEAGLELVDAVGDEPALRDYHLLASVRGHLLEEVGRGDEARIEFQRAAALTRNGPEKALMRQRSGMPSPLS